MQGSIQRVRSFLRGDPVERPPIYELLRNDAVIAHFAGEPPAPDNAREVVYRAYAPAVDATRPVVRLPERERTEQLADGREQRFSRWTVWTEHSKYADTAAWAAAKRAEIDGFQDGWDAGRQAGLEADLAAIAEERNRLGEVFFFPGAPSVGLMGIIGDVGLECFSWYLADEPGIVDDLMEIQTREALAWIAHLPAGHGIEAVFCGDDIAYKSGPLLPPSWFEAHYLGRLARVCAAYHAKGIRVLFHSDGNLMPVLDGLVAAGIDGLNPLEVLAGMDAAVIHRRHPRLFMAGGIDASQLLPFGTPGAVRDAVRRALDGAGGRIMIGSSTELENTVPLANWLALREAVLGYR
jgi:hypothetical protein